MSRSIKINIGLLLGTLVAFGACGSYAFAGDGASQGANEAATHEVRRN